MPTVRSGLITEERERRYIADPTITPGPTALFTDMYHVDATYVAWKTGQTGTATFDLYTRTNPFGGGFMLVAGLEPALDYLRAFKYSWQDREYLQATKGYEPEFLDYLRDIQFTGEIQAIPEGEIAFPNEPLLRITAPFAEALLIESGLLRSVGISTLIATKAARLTLAAKGRGLADFAFRRAHDPFLAARSGYIGGLASTSFVAAAKAYGIPTSGTIPHALVQAYPDELTAFRAVAATLPEYSLLLDTYDVTTGIGHAIVAGKEAQAEFGHHLVAVRLDSGDLDADSRMVRTRLDEAGMQDVRVLVSGDLDEWKVQALVDAGAPVDGFGVGGNLGVGLGSIESGTVGGVIGAVYKLASYGGDADEAAAARIKLAGGGDKSTWPGRKVPYRIGTFTRDVVALEEEAPPTGGRSLLQPLIRDGHLINDVPSIAEARARARASLDALPERLRSLAVPREERYEVEMSAALRDLRERTIAGISAD
ncbi:MAG TPA: nicotinate phosphoribosyltransferase [Thermomicrobiales bacterium]|nr:nicotinate phosphoribosyltransferase [Thermomicrobiales bacterium]